MAADLEQQRPVARSDKEFLGGPVETFSWSGLTVTVKDGKTGQSKVLVDNVEGILQAGECCAIMGPSGCGKTTFLNVLARRPINKATHVGGQVLINGVRVSDGVFRHVTAFVQDHDTFIGALTVKETLLFAARLAGVDPPRGAGGSEAGDRIDTLLESFGLAGLAEARVGRGISHGQKRRLAVAKQLVTGPRVLFLDEPTSGLDSVASHRVIGYLRRLARRTGLVVVCSIHQPSTSTFGLFDKLLLLSGGGRTQYFGPVGSQLIGYYAGIGVAVPERANPADFLLELVNTDFVEHLEEEEAAPTTAAAKRERVAELASIWGESSLRRKLCDQIESLAAAAGANPPPGVALPSGLAPGDGGHDDRGARPALSRFFSSFFRTRLAVLTHRSFVKAYRDGLAYTLRLAMYTALGLLAGTVWLRLDRGSQDSVQLLTNALLVSCGFMSFMAVTYVPAFVEDYRQFRLDRRNGLYGAGSLLLSNLAVGTPFLFLFAAAFSLLFYWLGNCRPDAGAFFTWTAWLFLDLLAAEGVVILCVAAVPSFVGALVVAAFLNVMAFSTAGTLVPKAQLNAFYRYGFYYWNYQSYVFQGMMMTQMDGVTYGCGEGCHCRYPPLPGQCRIAGETVLDLYGIKAADQGRNAIIALAIVLGYRLAAWIVLKMRN
ncbi:hypothetical protein VTH06DRAFT_6585 [Thermothelomyces fergusii]